MSMIYIKETGASGKGEGFSPSVFSWGLQDVSKSDAGRSENAKMHKNRVAQKRKISLAFNGTNKSETSRILKAVNPEYIDVTYPDAMSGQDETRTFYVGDRSAPVKIWAVGRKYYESVSFDIIER